MEGLIAWLKICWNIKAERYCISIPRSSAISFCDRSYATHLGSIIVKGYVLKWKYDANEKGEPLSEIEPVTDEVEQREISKLSETAII